MAGAHGKHSLKNKKQSNVHNVDSFVKKHLPSFTKILWIWLLLHIVWNIWIKHLIIFFSFLQKRHRQDDVTNNRRVEGTALFPHCNQETCLSRNRWYFHANLHSGSLKFFDFIVVENKEKTRYSLTAKLADACDLLKRTISGLYLKINNCAIFDLLKTFKFKINFHLLTSSLVFICLLPSVN